MATSDEKAYFVASCAMDFRPGVTGYDLIQFTAAKAQKVRELTASIQELRQDRKLAENAIVETFYPSQARPAEFVARERWDREKQGAAAILSEPSQFVSAQLYIELPKGRGSKPDEQAAYDKRKKELELLVKPMNDIDARIGSLSSQRGMLVEPNGAAQNPRHGEARIVTIDGPVGAHQPGNVLSQQQFDALQQQQQRAKR